MYLLDTNVVSELRKAGSGRADPRVVAWSASVPVAYLHLSVLTVMEIEDGIAAVKARDPLQHRTLRDWMDLKLMPSFAGRILDFDLGASVQCAALNHPQKRPLRDSMIAATALRHGMTVVTRDIGDFEGMVPVLNPWA